MIKKLSVILTLIAIVGMSFSKDFVILEFYANRSEIAAKYCINKNKPMLHCNGHCFLMKALKKESQREQALGDAFNKLEILICAHRFSTTIDTIGDIANKINNKTPLHNTTIWQLFIVNRLLKPPADKGLA